MSPNPAPFSPRVVLSMLLFGALAFLMTLYFIGLGENGRGTNDGGAHVGGRGLNGYAALADLLERRGWQIERSRSEARLQAQGLLVLTPPAGTEGDKFGEVVAGRRHAGPTMVILAKWSAMELSRISDQAEKGWVVLGDPAAPGLAGFHDDISLSLGRAARWRGAGTSGRLPVPDKVQSGSGPTQLVPLVTSDDGRILAGFMADEGQYPDLYAMAGVDPASGGDDEDLYPLVFVFEPDLLDNYGMARRENAVLADRLFGAIAPAGKVPVVFDLTFNGLGRSTNLLTLAFTPPFLAATLCLLIAAIAIAWRAFRRFGPPLAEERRIAFGKSQLVRNSAALIRRTGRLHLLGPPYAAMIRARMARALGLHRAGSVAETEAAIDRLLAARCAESSDFSARAERLGHARTAHELLRAAQALRQIERMLD
jgi:hypothetical protein